ncbi:YbbR-like domain-containing protein [Angelakisella massiliensis]|uniref:CdaR family protein n=1 Tax=Angelakisella massiliensis TaxID=1871018 RepID=UPI0008F944A8|nr:hypothetical protein [Angelakisella massiliensis]
MKLNLNFNLSEFSKRPSVTIAFSIICSVVLWFVITSSGETDWKKTVHDVPVEINLPSTSDLNVVEGEDATVTAEISGMRYNIGNFHGEDVRLQASLTGVTKPGTYTLRVEAVNEEGRKYEVLSITPSTIEVTFDREVERDIPLELELTGAEVPDEEAFQLGEATISPTMVTIQGPETQVNRIARGVVRATLTEPLSATEKLDLPIVFLDSDGNTVPVGTEGSLVTCNYETVRVEIPVLRIVELPTTLSFINVPTDFPLEELEYTLSNDYITVAATAETLSRYYEVPIGYVDLSQLDLTVNSSLTFKLQLPDAIRNYNNIENVVVEFNSEGFEAKTLSVRNIVIRNVPPDYDAQLLTRSINNVRMIGPSEIIDGLKSTDLVAEIDFADQEVQTGQYEVSVQIYAPNKGLVWAIGEYTAVVSVQEK